MEITVKVSVSPRQLAGELAGMDSSEQAKFFTCLAQELNAWSLTDRRRQLQYIAKSEHLTDEGRQVIMLLGHCVCVEKGKS